ncbi:Major facilitator superfamily (MFS) profile domain-containing protein [Plasmodiophora brassicae]|uniref:Major facilitator superfamily (MFS) profile domain-containing protein n=1 Tax=Plasmodiophora brassicae TaxID=37360 RepID=A0A0G4IX95_PLABS|nr:hypothetical protein PBRA_007606 [Plasmodiophora brassicae]
MKASTTPAVIYGMMFLFAYESVLVLSVILPIIRSVVPVALFSQHKGALMQGALSALLLANGVGGLVWGRLSDRAGRRVAVVICIVGTAVAFVAVALSRSYAVLLVALAFVGLFDSVGVIAKVGPASLGAASVTSERVAQSCLGDISTDDNRKQRFSSLMTAQALAYALGPVATAVTPATLDVRPGLIPILAFVALLALLLVVVFAVFPETLRPNDEENDDEQRDLESGDVNGGGRRRRVVWVCVASYSLLWLLLSGTDMLLPLLTVEEAAYGGMGLASTWVGTFLTAQGVAYVAMQVVVYPALARTVVPDPVVGCRVGFACMAIVVPAGYLPAVVPFPVPAMVVVLVLRTFAQTLSLTSVLVCLDLSAPPATKGSINGTCQSVACLTAFLGVAAGGVLFDAGQAARVLFLPYAVFALVAIGTFALTMLLPASLCRIRASSPASSTLAK